MADFEGAKPIKSVRDNDVAVKIVDGASGTTATKKLTIIEEGVTYVAGTNDFGVPVMGIDADGKSVLIPVPLPITDNGSSITVDGSVTVSGTVAISNTTFEVTQGTNPWVVSASDLDIRDLDYTQDNIEIKDADGDALEINTDGSINAQIPLFPLGATKVYDHKTTATVGQGSEVIHFYTVTNTKTFLGKRLVVGARGQVKVRFGYSSNGTSITTVKETYFQDPRDNREYNIEMAELLGDATAAIAIGITNLDGQSSDVFSSLQGLEV